MRHRRPIKPRRAIFFGVEGKSEQAFLRFLQHVCNENDRCINLTVFTGSGGDTVSVVQEAHRSLKRHSGRNHLSEKLVLLDRDRVETDRRAGRDAVAIASGLDFKIIFQDPNLEGLLVRLHQGFEHRTITRNTVKGHLRNLWPEYDKPPKAAQMIRRFDLANLQRAAKYDNQLRQLLDVLAL